MIKRRTNGCGRVTVAVLAAALSFSAATSVAQSGLGDADLAGTVWLAEDIGGRGVVDRARSTLQFVDTGQVSGSTGCNRFFGPVELDGDKISFGNLGVTRMACQDTLMDQEQRFLEALSEARRVELAHQGQILLMYGDGGQLVLRSSRIVEK